MFTIEPLVSQFDDAIQAIINEKTKPLGALGQLEPLALQLVKIQLNKYHSTAATIPADFMPKISAPELIVFAGDHGVAAEGVSIAPSEVTGQMVANFAHGGAAINVFTRQLGWQLTVVDAGILQPLTIESTASCQVLDQRLGNITKAIHQFPAMTLAQVNTGFELAKKLVDKKIADGCNLIAFGEMGIGNTTIAAAIMSAILAIPPSESVGKGTGIDDDVLRKKQLIIEIALTLHQNKLSDPLALLTCLGGFEVVQITGAMLAAAEQKIAIVVDGFITTAAALVACQMYPAVKDYLVFAHCSGEQGHQKMLAWLEATPLLNLGLRLGEGTGAALSLPLISAAINFYNQMASFSQAQVVDVVSAAKE
ncbi:MAG: nicotinate-nucleotide--dimethylbenzimidazole phosphoribosyltransferase [Thalassotalea sp.]